MLHNTVVVLVIAILCISHVHSHTTDSEYQPLKRFAVKNIGSGMSLSMYYMHYTEYNIQYTVHK